MVLTKEQENWIEKYRQETGCEPCIARDELDSGEIGFSEFADINMKWWVDSAHEQMRSLEGLVPRDEE